MKTRFSLLLIAWFVVLLSCGSQIDVDDSTPESTTEAVVTTTGAVTTSSISNEAGEAQGGHSGVLDSEFDQHTLLAEHIQEGDLEGFVELVEAGADPLELDGEGGSLLMGAGAEFVPIMVGMGLDPNHESNLGSTPISMAVLGGQRATLRALLENGGDPVLAMYNAIAVLDVETCEFLAKDYGVTFTEPPPPDTNWVLDGGISSPRQLLEMVEPDNPAAAQQIREMLP